MLYKTNCAISLKGDRVNRGAEIELTDAEAKHLGGDVTLIGGVAPEPEVVIEDKPLEAMNGNELKAKAEALGLSKGGSLADLRERITIALEAQPEMIDHVVTEEDLEADPTLAEKGTKVGDTIQIPKPEETN